MAVAPGLVEPDWVLAHSSGLFNWNIDFEAHFLEHQESYLDCLPCAGG